MMKKGARSVTALFQLAKTYVGLVKI